VANRPRVEWQKEANCTGLSIQEKDRVFFPGRGRPYRTSPHEKYCVACPVVKECLEYALVHREEGVWGNTTLDQRKLFPLIQVEILTRRAQTERWLEDHYGMVPSQTQAQPLPEDSTVNPFDFPLFQVVA